jgi:hypothetical protein
MTLTEALETMRGQPDRLIAEATNEPLWKVREWRRAAGIKGQSGDRSHWNRRDWLLAGAAGIDVDCTAVGGVG